MEGVNALFVMFARLEERHASIVREMQAVAAELDQLEALQGVRKGAKGTFYAIDSDCSAWFPSDGTDVWKTAETKRKILSVRLQQLTVIEKDLQSELEQMENSFQ